MDTRVYWIWLQQALGIGHPDGALALEQFGGAEQVYRLEGEALAESGFSPESQARLADKSLAAAQAVLALALEQDGWLMLPPDTLYPPLLRDIYAPPLVLYGRGEVPDFERQPGIAVVGTRDADQAGIAVAGGMAAGLTAGGAILVSGSARGVDAAALTAGLRQGGGVVSVQACGLEQTYPDATWELRQEILREGGTLFSEYPPGTPPNGAHFQARNRLLSGLSMGVCVINAPERSGALITARWAREQGRDLFAVPGDVLSGRHDGANHLIREGAQLISRPGEILREYVFRYGDALDVKAADTAYMRELARLRQASETGARWDEVSIDMAPAGRPARRGTVPAAGISKAEAPSEAEKPPCPAEVSDAAAQVYAVLCRDPLAVDEIAAAAALDVGTALAALTELELLGCAEGGAGQRYRLMEREG